MKTRFAVLFVAAILITPALRAQEQAPAPPQGEPSQTFFQSVNQYFTSFNPALPIAAPVEVWTAMDYQDQLNFAAALGLQYNFNPKGSGWVVEGVVRNAGIAGVLVDFKGGGGYSWVKFDTKFTVGLDVGYRFDVEEAACSLYADVRKSLTENTFAGIRLAYETEFSHHSPHSPVVSIITGFKF